MAVELFVTGTDTGVGKTAVAVALLRAAAERGMSALGVKPVESGWPGPLGEDGAALRDASTFHVEPEDVTTYCLSRPLAPTVAAAREGRVLDWSLIEGTVARARARAADLLVVEGAGGLLVPITEDRNMAEAALALEMSLLVVARDSLGTINHTCLTVEAAQRRGVTVAGVILNGVKPGTSADDVEENARQIEQIAGVPVLGCVPHGEPPTRRLTQVDLDRLFGER